MPDVILVEAKKFGDDRGFFMETYQFNAFEQNGISLRFVQDNFSHSSRGVLRGLHYQINPDAQGKLVRAVSGEIFDVAVDIRKGSPTYGQWVGEMLSRENGRLLWVPPGFAHGFCVVSEKADVAYKVTGDYSPSCDRGIIWNDPAIGIDWPIDNPSLSPKDVDHPTLENADNNFTYQEK
ncbi:MAG: dTDP-4-dehydrorhamnose 3,5-epimerase [Chloroflexota bacterium]